jgi:hypothetical protein
MDPAKMAPVPARAFDASVTGRLCAQQRRPVGNRACGADLETASGVTQSSTLLQGLNVGQLRRSGVVLYPREVVAVVHALCDQDVCVSSPDELWITAEGQVLVDHPGRAPALASRLASFGVLIDSLLPPFTEERQYAPAASLQTIPARLSGTAEPAIVSTRELLYVIGPYETDAPERVLQQLVARVITAAPARPGRDTVMLAPARSDSTARLGVPLSEGTAAVDEHPVERSSRPAVDSTAAPDRLANYPPADAPDLAAAAALYEAAVPARVLPPVVAATAAASARPPAVTPAQIDDDGSAFLIVPFEGGDDALDEYPSEQIAHTGVDAAAPSDRHSPLDVVAERETAPTSASRWRTLALVTMLCVGISLGLFGYGACQLLADRENHDGRRAVPATIDPPPPLSAHPIDLGVTTLIPSPHAKAPSRPRSPVELDGLSPLADGGPLPPPLPPADDRPQDDDSATDASSPRALNLPVTDGAFSPSFATTGGAVFFHAGRRRGGRLLEADLDDRGAPFQIVTVLQDDANNYHPRVSPDERLIAFDSDRDGERGVYVADRDGTNVHRVSGPGFAALPSWSPDMRWLAFVRAERDRPEVWNLWLRDMASGELTRLTSYRFGQTWAASWFPDAQRVCYSHEDQLVVRNLVTGATAVHPSPLAGRLVRTPAVSPDGHRAVFQVFRDGAWLLDLESGAMRKILNDATAEEFAWHPLGHRVAYHSRKDGEWRIWVTAPSS